MERALAAPLTATDLRVLLALFSLVTLYDRLEDRVSNRQLCEATGIKDDRRVRRAIARLSDLGIVEREPGSSRPGERRVASLFRFPLTEGSVDPGSEAPPGVSKSHDRGSLSAETGGLHVPASEVLSETSSEVRMDESDRARTAALIEDFRKANPLFAKAAS